jgi:modulator of FtsH protease
MANQFDNVVRMGGAEGSVIGVEQTNKVLRNTYMLLSMTLLFSAAMAGVSMAMNVPYGISLVTSLVALGLLWFVVPRTANSSAGIGVVFGVPVCSGLVSALC